MRTIKFRGKSQCHTGTAARSQIAYQEVTEQKNRIMTNEQTLSMQGYVTRDPDGRLSLFLNRPIRNTYEFWQSPKIREIEHELPESAFPDLTWDDEPIEVEILIRRKLNTNSDK